MKHKTDDVLVDGHLSKHRYDFYGADTEDATRIVNEGLAQSGSGTTVRLASSASSTDDAYNGYGLVIDSGTGSVQDHFRISDYNGTTKDATLSSALTTDLDTTSHYQVINRGY